MADEWLQNELAVSFHVSSQCVSCELKFFTGGVGKGARGRAEGARRRAEGARGRSEGARGRAEGAGREGRGAGAAGCT